MPPPQRKIIQIQIVKIQAGEFEHIKIIGLADDGSIWEKTHTPMGGWPEKWLPVSSAVLYY